MDSNEEFCSSVDEITRDLQVFFEKRNNHFAIIAMCEIIIHSFIQDQITKEKFLSLMDDHWEIIHWEILLGSRKLQSEKENE